MKSKDDYEGIYHIVRRPQSRKPHNAESWAKIESLAASELDGKMDFERIALAVRGHSSGTETAPHAYQFVTYCIRSGWLRQV